MKKLLIVALLSALPAFINALTPSRSKKEVSITLSPDGSKLIVSASGGQEKYDVQLTPEATQAVAQGSVSEPSHVPHYAAQ